MNARFVVFVLSLISFATASHLSARTHHHKKAAHKYSFLQSHNEIRQAHFAADLNWSDELENMAKQWASGCNLAHTDGSLSEEIAYGELMYAQSGGVSAEDVVVAFASDACEFGNTQASSRNLTVMQPSSTPQHRSSTISLR